jgi:hypothetical protein
MFLREGDVNTRFFHLQACHRGHKNHIDVIMHDGLVLVEEAQKADAVFAHFDTILGTYPDRVVRLHLNLLVLPVVNTVILNRSFLRMKYGPSSAA